MMHYIAHGSHSRTSRPVVSWPDFSACYCHEMFWLSPLHQQTSHCYSYNHIDSQEHVSLLSNAILMLLHLMLIVQICLWRCLSYRGSAGGYLFIECRGVAALQMRSSQ